MHPRSRASPWIADLVQLDPKAALVLGEIGHTLAEGSLLLRRIMEVASSALIIPDWHEPSLLLPKQENSALEDARDLSNRSAADVSGDDQAGRLSDHSGDRIGGALAQHLVPDHHLPEIDDHGCGKQWTHDGRVPPPLLCQDDG
jgi:hypothetical protein